MNKTFNFELTLQMAIITYWHQLLLIWIILRILIKLVLNTV